MTTNLAVVALFFPKQFPRPKILEPIAAGSANGTTFMSRCFKAISFALIPSLTIAQSARAQSPDLDAKAVNLAIDRAVAYLVSTQNKETHAWADHHGQPGGLTALCCLAILNAGIPAKDERVKPTLDYLCNVGKPTMVYASSLTVMALCAAYPTATADRSPIYASKIREHAMWLEAVQIKDGERKGGWRYGREAGQGDNSNSQFALLALHEAERTLPEIKISEQTWRLALAYWTEQQGADGSWGYIKGVKGPVANFFGAASGSMTCAGISSVIIASGQIGEGDAEVSADGTLQCCGARRDNDAVERGLAWLGKHFSVEQNPSPGNASSWHLYYLYGVERVGRLSGRRFFYGAKGGARDWYREGAEQLIKVNLDPLTGRFAGTSGDEERVAELSTAFSLLFLAKGRRPVVMAKLHWGEPGSNDWDHHRAGVQNLTAHIEKLWKRDLAWQTIDLNNAKVVDLLESPVLVISGSGAFDVSDGEKKALKEYVQQGGFIFAEACQGEGCDGSAFDASFRKLLVELFPESSLRLLPPDHPVWFADEKVDPKFVKPLYGLDTCCRTAVVYCPENLSCFWSLKRPLRGKELNAELQRRVDACAAMGANVVAYATNRELKEKLDRPKYFAESGAKPQRAALVIPKLAHGGGSDDAPNAIRNLDRYLEKQLEVRVEPKPVLLPPDNAKLFDYPIVFMHGRRSFKFNNAERKSLHDFLSRGGFLFADSICANAEFAESFRREFQTIFPEAKWQRIPSDHAIFTNTYRGFDLKTVSLRDPQARGEDEKLTARIVKTSPLLEGFEIDGRLVVVFSPNDLSCALENSQSLECKGYTRDDAARIAANIVLYALSE